MRLDRTETSAVVMAAALAVLLIIGVVAYVSTAGLVRTSQRVQVRQASLTHLSALLSATTDAETGQRGYIITGEDAYLEPYHKAGGLAEGALDGLRVLAGSDAGRLQVLDELGDLVRRRLRRSAEMLEARRTGGFEAAREAMMTGDGLRLHNRIRDLVASLELAERDALASMISEARGSARFALAVIVIGSVMGMGLVGVSVMLWQKDRVARRVAEGQVRETLAGLEGRIIDRTLEITRANAALAESEARLRERNEELMRFIYTVSHDLKSPLVTIQTFLGYLEKDMATGDSAKVATDVGYIRKASGKMVELLDDILELSRVGRKVQPPEDVTLKALVGDALDVVAGAVAAAGINVQVTQEPLVLTGDRRRLLELFQNLLDNAVKFMGEQSAPTIEVGAELKNGDWVLFVRDNGIGIDPRHQAKLFGLFEKLHPGFPGNGIGLAIVKRIVEVHGGRIWAESEGAGRGTTFRFTLRNTRRQPPRDDDANTKPAP